MPSISIQKLAIHRSGTFDPNNPHISKIELEIIFNVDKSRLIAYQIFNAQNVRIQTVRNRFYNKGETLYATIRETSFYDPALMPREEYGADGQVRLVAWLIDGNNQRISDMATRILNVPRATPEKIQQYEQLVESLKTPEELITEPAAVTVTEPLLPEISILPEAHAEHVPPEPVEVWPTLSQETKKIINDFPANLKAPDWALTYISNNINWLLEGKITETVFLTGYYDYVKKGTIILIDEPEPIVDQVTTNMIRQELLNFTIVNNRIQGSIKFIATNSFNPYYYNKEITNYLQLKSNDKIILIKTNRLRFTETERDEVINFDEYAFNLDSINAESYARNNADLDMAEVLTFTIEAGKEATTTKTGFMGAGVLGLIGILMLGGFIADHVRKRK